MKILTILSLMITILNPYIKNANGTYASKVQASYEYSIGYVDLYSDGIGGYNSAPYYIDININFDAYYSGTIYINMNSPASTTVGGSTWGASFYPTYVSVSARYLTSGYTNAGSTSFGFSFTNVNSFFVRLIYKPGALQFYNLQNMSTAEQNWVNNGASYIYINSISVSSLTETEDSSLEMLESIDTSLNYIESSNSTIAGLLTTINTRFQILTNNNTVSLDTLKSIMDNAYALSLKNFTFEEWINGVVDSKSHELNTGFYDLSSFSSYTAYESSDGTYYGKYTVKNYEPRNENVYIILALPRSTGQTQFYYFTYPLGVGSMEMAQYIYIYDLDSNYIYRYGLFSSRVDGVSYFRFVTDRLSLTDLSITSRTDYINGIYITNKAVTELGVLYDIDRQLISINEILGNININNSDLTNKTTVDNFLQNLLQNLNLPLFPDKDTQPMFPIIQRFIGYFGEIINNQHLGTYRWLLSLSAVFIVLKVILL